MCGTCGRQLVGVCQCGHCAPTCARKSARLVADGKNEDEIVQYFIDKYGGQEPLAAPLDKGFNRLAWLFPYLIGASGLLVIGVAARALVAAEGRADAASASTATRRAGVRAARAVGR